MTNLHTDVTETTHATRRRRLTRVLAVGAIAAGAVVGAAVPAQAAGITAYHVTGTSGAGSRVVSDPGSATAATIAMLADGTSVTVDCGVRGRSVNRNTVWHHITSPVTGYIADYYTDTPGFNRFISGEATCSPVVPPSKPAATPTTPTTTPTTPAATPTTPSVAPTPSKAVVTRGATITYNEGVGGSCVYYALDRFHQLTGVYPKAFGDAKYLATGAAASGWTVSATPLVNSIVVFQPGQNGAAAPTGHAAWVEQVSGDRVYIAEMNAPTAWVVTHRWVTPATGVRYIYAA
jgi:surface antigen